MKLKFGLKLWSSNPKMLKQAKRLIEEEQFNYIELTPIPKTEISPFLKCNVQYVIHVPTEKQGVNIAEKREKDFNLRIVNECIKWADKLDAKYLILHPGYGLVYNAIEFLKYINNKKILIENMPKVGLNNENMIGYAPEEIKLLLRCNKLGFCLDFGHAIKAAVSLSKQYKEFIQEFLNLDPKMFHISDGKLNNEKDEHLNIGQGDYDFKFLMNCVKKSKKECLTLETLRDESKFFEDDIKNLERLRIFA